MSNATDEILEIEMGFWTKATDPHYFEDHMADRALSVIEPMGFVEKAQVVKMPAEQAWTDVEMLDVQVRQITPECVILAYHGRGQRSDQKSPYEGSIASTYLRINGAWQLVLSSHQPWKPRA